MKSYKILAIALAALSLASCTDSARIKGVLDGAQKKQLVVRQLNTTIDTIKTKANGSFAYKMDVKKGQPEFVYLYYGDIQVAALLLEKGETAVVKADTLGKYEVSGSEGSIKLAEVNKKFTDFLSALSASTDQAEANKLYLDHYRESVKYVMENSKSLTVIPVLYEKISPDFPVFAQSTDAIFFRNITDSLKTVYPDSKYVKSLEIETAARVNAMVVGTAMANAPEQAYPNLDMPDMRGKRVSLNSLDYKLLIVHFWDASDAGNKMTNLETLLPVYQDYHAKGMEIYSVCLDIDKAEWGSVVTAQKLPWINVNDGLGINSPSVSTYGVQGLPCLYFIADGELKTVNVKDAASFRREVAKILK